MNDLIFIGNLNFNYKGNKALRKSISKYMKRKVIFT